MLWQWLPPAAAVPEVLTPDRGLGQQKGCATAGHRPQKMVQIHTIEQAGQGHHPS